MPAEQEIKYEGSPNISLNTFCTFKPNIPMEEEIIKVAGYYRLGDKGKPYIRFGVDKKPCWFHRLCVRILLGWPWDDYDEQEKK